jgi:hypothetical protein
MLYAAYLAEQGDRAHLLDDNHFFLWSYGSVEYFEDCGWPHDTRDGEDLVLTGIITYHRLLNGNCCGGFLSFALPLRPSKHEADRAVWDVHSLDPLTIAPSVLCHCGDHGFIRDGCWVSA